MILAIDPGGVTGCAVFDAGRFTSYEITGDFEQQAQELQTTIHQCDVRTVVCESFVITPATGKLGSDEQKYYPLMLIGVVRMATNSIRRKFVPQSPAQRKLATENKYAALKALGWHKPTKGNHANDAAAHLLTYMLRNNLLPADLKQKLVEAA